MIGTPDFYDGPEHEDAQIRSECRNTGRSTNHYHTIRPFEYDKNNHPGNYGGLIIACDSDLDATVARALEFHANYERNDG